MMKREQEEEPRLYPPVSLGADCSLASGYKPMKSGRSPILFARMSEECYLYSGEFWRAELYECKSMYSRDVFRRRWLSGGREFGGLWG